MFGGTVTIPVTISKEDLQKLPMISFPGRIHLPRSLEELNAAAEQILAEPVVGFDTETRPSFRKGEFFRPSLVQISSEHDAWLFQLKKIESVTPLLRILESSMVRKTGVALDGDVRQLRDFIPFDPAGFVELGTIARQAGMEKTGLRNLCGILLGFRISKRAQTSNWARVDLTPEQIAYAATDAWISLKLYQRLRQNWPDLFKGA